MNARFDPDAITIERGTEYTHLASWRHAREGRFGVLWHTAVGGRNETAGFYERRANIAADKRLSEPAKRDDAKKVALEALQSLGKRQRELNLAIAQHNEVRKNLGRIERGDARDAVIDAELARLYRTTSGNARTALNADLVAGRHPEMIVALMRLPSVLFGMTPEIQDSVTSNWIARQHPEEVAELQQLSEASRTCQHVLSKCVDIVSGGVAGGLSLEERMVSLGEGAWQQHARDGSPAALSALATKYGVTAA